MKTENSETDRLYLKIFETISDGVLITDLETGSILDSNPAAAQMHGYTQDAFRGLRLQSLLSAKSLPFFADYASVIKQGGLFEMQAQHVRRDDLQIFVEWRAVMGNYQGKPCALAVIRDISKRVEAEIQLQQRVVVRTREQAALLEISENLASTLEMQPDLILAHLEGLIKYSRASLFVLEDSTLIALAVRGVPQLQKSVPFRIPLIDKQMLNTLFNGHHPIRIADLWSNEPSAKFMRALLENEPSAILMKKVQSWMWVPLAVKNRVLGGIGIAHTSRNYFTPHQANLAMTVANQVAVTLVNARLYEHAQTLAALQERQRLAQNLHDAVNQSLFSAGLIAEVLPRLWDRDQKEARRSLEDLRRLTRGAQAEMRALLAELRPSTLTDSDLGDLLRLLGNAFTGRTNIPTKITVNGEGSLPPETQVALYRICQEALNNIVKHAGASHVEIDVLHAPEELKLHIRDNGCGFNPSEVALSGGHYGLRMMRERAETVGAALAVTSQPGSGTELAIHWAKKDAK